MAENSNTTVMIGVPTHKGEFHPKMSHSLDNLTASAAKSRIGIILNKAVGALVAINRNNIIDAAIERDVDYVLFIDSDMIFDGDILLDLLKHDRDIVSALCVKKRPPYNPVASVVNKDGKYVPRDNLGEGRFYSDLDGVGTAFVLIKTDVFRKIKRPWFASPPYLGTVMGEDYYFSQKAKEAGYDICVDTSLVVGHLGDYPYTIYDHLNYVKAEKEKK